MKSSIANYKKIPQKSIRSIDGVTPVGGKAALVAILDDLVGVHDDGDEEGQHHVDEQADERVQVHPAVHPHGKRTLQSIIQLISQSINQSIYNY